MRSDSYVRKDGIYHRFDVRAKLVFTIAMTAAVFFIAHLWFLYLLAASLFLFSVMENGWRKSTGSILLILPMIIIMFIFMPLGYRNGTALLVAGSFTVLTKEALENFLLIAGRFVNISLLFSLLVQTSRSEEILLALEWFRLPSSAAMVLTLASRFIPELAATFHQIRESQSLRLPSPDEEGQRRRPFASILPSLISAVVSALRSIPLTAGAIDLRGYGRKEKRTHYKILANRGKNLFTHFAVSLSIALIIFILGRLL